jgi:hypothetical protein
MRYKILKQFAAGDLFMHLNDVDENFGSLILSLCYTGVLRPDSIQLEFDPEKKDTTIYKLKKFQG